VCDICKKEKEKTKQHKTVRRVGGHTDVSVRNELNKVAYLKGKETAVYRLGPDEMKTV